jgi:hypothetical protein
MPNIYIKTRMRKMPECCLDCEAFLPDNPNPRKDIQGNRDAAVPGCAARAPGKYQQLTHFSCNGINHEQERPAWCPLVEREDQASEKID